MSNRRILSAVVGLGWLTAIAALGADTQAAPNYYSKSGTTQVEARIAVTSPVAGKVEPGATIRITWKKRTPEAKVNVWLYSATAGGARDDKIMGIVAPRGSEDGSSASGGSFLWKIPEDLSPGRYVVVVTSGLDEATSAMFSVIEPPIKLGAPHRAARGTLTSADLQAQGARGSIKLSDGQREVEYSWGSGKCPSLLGGLPGALVTLTALGRISIEPIVREVTKHNQVQQTCLDGFIVLAPAEPDPS